VRASRAFHAALAGVPAPRWLGRDGSQWTVADQVAWSERDPGPFTVPDTADGQGAGSQGAGGRRTNARGANARDAGNQAAEEDPGAELRRQVSRLLAAFRPVTLPAQLMHGDFGGNVLFADGEPPAVIDFSPYWRPAGLAIAVAAVDALLWYGARPDILQELAGEPDLNQLLARALVFRLVTEIIARDGRNRDHAGLASAARAGQPVTDLVLARLAAR
jgi:hypothetical protein